MQNLKHYTKQAHSARAEGLHGKADGGQDGGLAVLLFDGDADGIAVLLLVDRERLALQAR